MGESISGWIVSVCFILLACAFFGRLAKKIGQNKVIGEIAAGITLGPTVFGAWFPQASTLIFSPDSVPILKALSELGLIILMFEVPWHASGSGRGQKKQLSSAFIAFLGIALSFVAGGVMGIYSKEAIAPAQPYWAYVAFCGIALSVTALPVLVRIVQDNSYINAQVGGMALSAAIYTDLFAWFALALVLALQFSGEASVVNSLFRVFGLIAFFVLSFRVLRPLVRHSLLFSSLDERSKVGIALVYGLFSAEVTALLGFHQAIGAIMAAYVFYDVPSIESAWKKWIGRFGHLFLTPIFFATSGLQVSLGAFSELSLWLWLLLFIIGGSLGKILGSYISGRMSGLAPRESIELGMLMNAKGLVELVVLEVGVKAGVLSETSYTVLLLFSLISTVLTPPSILLLNRYVRKNQGGCSSSQGAGV